MKWDYVNSWLLEKDLSKGLVFFVSNTIFFTALSERGEKKDTVPFMFPGLCVILFAWITQLVYFVAILGF